MSLFVNEYRIAFFSFFACFITCRILSCSDGAVLNSDSLIALDNSRKLLSLCPNVSSFNGFLLKLTDKRCCPVFSSSSYSASSSLRGGECSTLLRYSSKRFRSISISELSLFFRVVHPGVCAISDLFDFEAMPASMLLMSSERSKSSGVSIPGLGLSKNVNFFQQQPQ